MMLTAVIIDDEPKGRLALRQKLKDYCPEIGLAGEAGSGEEGLRLIEEHEPEIVFLDIEMPRMNGFEMLQRLPRKNFHLIFTTAYDQYAIQAIKFAAFDYLLKPIDIEELKAAIEKVKQQQVDSSTTGKLEVLEHNLHIKNSLGKIAISTLEGLLFFNLNDIVHLEAQGNYTIFHFSGRPKLTASKTLKEIEELLPEDTFFRTHHSHIINLHYIKRYIKGDGGQIELLNGDLVDLARRKKDSFLKLIGY
jgi:two-component system LytT family response regulator